MMTSKSLIIILQKSFEFLSYFYHEYSINHRLFFLRPAFCNGCIVGTLLGCVILAAIIALWLTSPGNQSDPESLRISIGTHWNLSDPKLGLILLGSRSVSNHISMTITNKSFFSYVVKLTPRPSHTRSR